MDIEALKTLSVQWKSIETTEQREKFYQDKVFPAVKKFVVIREQEKYPEPYRYLILTVGLSPEPIILSILTLRPEYICLLYTEQSKRFLDQILEECNLKVSQVELCQIQETNLPHIYRSVRGIYEKWGHPDRIAVDPTGGTKAMVAGCALAGSMLGATLVYVNSNYIGHLRKPEPGSEQLITLDNPYDVFGDLKLKQAEYLFCQKDFVGAESLLHELERETSTPERYQSIALLCRAYAAWDDWKISQAIDALREALATVKRYSRVDSQTPLANQVSLLQEQLSVLGNLKQAIEQIDADGESEVLGNPSWYLPMMATLRACAIRQEQRGKLDVAVLLWYRLVEFLSQQRLHSYGLITSSPNYQGLEIGEEELLEKFQKAINTEKKKNQSLDLKPLPKPISLMDGYTLLKALGDTLMDNQSLSTIRGKVNARDNGIFAHGFKPLNQKDYDGFKGLTEQLITTFKEIDPVNATYWKECEFINHF